MTAQRKPALVKTFIHPAFGKCDRLDRYFAIRWRPDAAAGDRAGLLQIARVELATLDDDSQPPLPQLHQTDRFSWLQGPKGAPISAESVATLESSAKVEWVSPAYRAVEKESEVFTLNPTRIYVKETALARVGSIFGLRKTVTSDTNRTLRLRGYVALTVESPNPDGSLTAAATAAAVLEALSREGGTVAPGEVRFETIQFRPSGIRNGELDADYSDYSDSEQEHG
jgi:hypothetical protein